MRTLKYGWKVFVIYYKANGISAVLDITNKIYESTIYPLVQVFLLARLLDLLAANHHLNFSDIWFMAAVYITASIIKTALFNLSVLKGPGLEFALNDYVELQIDEKLNTLDPAVFESTKFQTLLAQMNGVKGAMTSYLVRMTDFTSSAFKMLIAVVVVSTKFPVFVPIIILSAVPAFFSLNKYRDNIWPFMSKERGMLERLFAYIRNTLSAAATSKEVAIYKNGPVLIKKFKSEHGSYYKRFAKAYNKTFLLTFVSGMVQVFAFAATQAINLASVFAGKLAIGQFTLYFQQTLNLADGANGTLDTYSSMSMRSKYVDQYFELLDYPNYIIKPEKPTPLPKKPTPATLEFKNVFFKYPESDRYILKDFNLKIESGEKIALVGENGAGKSTLIKLLLRFFDVGEGELLVNGVNIRDLNLDDWYMQVGALFQDFIKYQFTFGENVAFGNLGKGGDMGELMDAIKKSGADSFLKDLPGGIDQVVGKMFEGGVDLSGGQWQKLALARAFFRDAPILILDEPTSAIDAKAEYEIFQRVQKLQKDKTVIIISHRFSTVRNADRILVLDEGKIIEEGNHSSLMKKKGLYAELFNIQAQGYQ